MSSNRIYMICLHCTLAIKQIKPGKDTSYDKHLSRFRSRSPITLSAFDLLKKDDYFTGMASKNAHIASFRFWDRRKAAIENEIQQGFRSNHSNAFYLLSRPILIISIHIFGPFCLL
jgi:hypothetical protein